MRGTIDREGLEELLIRLTNTKITNVVAFVNNIWYNVSTFIVKRWKKTMRYKFLKSVLETYFLRSWASDIEIWRMINDLINDGVFMRIIENQPKKS